MVTANHFHVKLFLFLALGIVAVLASSCSKKVTQNSFSDYYRYTQKAEEAILEEDLKSAAHYYDKAFSYTNFAFGTDLYTAAVCHTSSEKNRRAYRYLRDIIRKGYGLEHLETEEALVTFFESRHGRRLQRRASRIDNTHDTIVRATLDSLFFMDRFVRGKGPDGEQIERASRDEILATDVRNRIRFLEIVEKHGFPGEALIGLSENDLTSQPYHVLVLHFQQRSISGEEGFDPMTDLIIEAVQEGLIHNREAVSLLEQGGRQYGQGMLTPTAVVLRQENDNTPKPELNREDFGFYPLTNDERLLSFYNNKRKELFLESLADEREKVMQLFYHSGQHFRIRQPYRMTLYMTCPDTAVRTSAGLQFPER